MEVSVDMNKNTDSRFIVANFQKLEMSYRKAAVQDGVD